MTADARTATLTGVVGVLLGALVTVCAWIAVELVERAPPSSTVALAERFGVSVVYVDGLECDGPRAGCYRPRTPDVVYLRPDLGDAERDVLLHELAHVLQHRASVGLDECAADRIALELGASSGQYACPPG